MLTIGSDNGCEPARKQAIFSKEFDHALCVHMVIEPQCVDMNVHYVNNYVTITVRSVERISASIPIARDLLFTRYITKSRSNEIAWENRNIALKFCMRLGSSATETPVKFHSNWKGKLQSRCFEISYDLATSYCPACRTTFIATRFRVAVICPIIPVPRCIRVFFYFVWFVFINHIFQFYYELCTYCNILDIYLSKNLNFVNYVLFYMKLLNYLFFSMFVSVLESCELTGVCLLLPWLIKWKYGSLFKN